MKNCRQVLQADDAPILSSFSKKRSLDFGPTSVQIPRSLLARTNGSSMKRCVSDDHITNSQRNKRKRTRPSSLQSTINIRNAYLRRRQPRLNRQRNNEDWFPPHEFISSVTRNASLNCSPMPSIHSINEISLLQERSVHPISICSPERSSNERYIIDAVREQFQPMLQDTQLSPKVNDIRPLHSRDVVLAETSILGVGTFSRVTKVTLKDRNTASNNNNKEIYACKQLKQELLSNVKDYIKAAAELAYEAFILSSLDHPNIIKLRGLPEEGIACFGDVANETQDMSMLPASSFFLIMDVLQETLDQRIERWNTISRPQTLVDLRQRNLEKISLCDQLASVLQYLHSKGVVYRDLKPQNIGFCEQQGGSLKLFDFGLCQELPSSIATSSGSSLSGNGNESNPNEHKRFDLTGMVGTIRYMAPEVCLSQPYNRDCDIYSWSIVAWEIWNQTKPFSSFTPDLYKSLVCEQGYRPTHEPSEKSIPDNLKDLLKQAWTTEPHKRIRWPEIRQRLEIFQKMEGLLLQETIIKEDIAIQLRRSVSPTIQYPICLSGSSNSGTQNGRVNMDGSDDNIHGQKNLGSLSNEVYSSSSVPTILKQAWDQHMFYSQLNGIIPFQ